MERNALAEQLMDFGFSEKEAETYLTIVELGEAKASRIAEEAGVSKRYVYNIRETFEERGFVTVNDHVVPTTIEAVPPEEMIDRLESRLERLEPALDARYDRTQDSMQEFEVVKSRATVYKRIPSLIAAAEAEITMALRGSLLEDVERELSAAVDRGVFVVLLVMGELDRSEEEFAGVASVVRHWDERAPTLLTVDSTSGLFVPDEMLERAHADEQAIVFAQEMLVPTLTGSLLGNYWPVADEVYVAQPSGLPREYTSFRHIVVDATLYLRRGERIAVTFEGRPAGSEADPETITGEVVDTRQGLVRPTSNMFAIENSLFVESEAYGRISVGGFGAFIEDFEAEEFSLSAAEEPVESR